MNDVDPFAAVQNVTRLLAALNRFAELQQRWEDALDTGCPSCGPWVEACDHIEGYHHALADLRAARKFADPIATDIEGTAS